jgi:Ni/Co efflux regulator RcnB
MRHRITKAVLALTAITAFALPGVAQARHGADDPAGHVRHARHHHHTRHHHHSTVRHHGRHGADDGVAHARHGADDGPNHR